MKVGWKFPDLRYPLAHCWTNNPQALKWKKTSQWDVCMMYCWWFRPSRKYGDSRWLEVLPPTLPDCPLEKARGHNPPSLMRGRRRSGSKNLSCGFEQHWDHEQKVKWVEQIHRKWYKMEIKNRFLWEIHIISKNLVYVCTLRCQVRACPPKKTVSSHLGWSLEKCDYIICSGPHHKTTGKLRTFDLQTGVSL